VAIFISNFPPLSVSKEPSLSFKLDPPLLQNFLSLPSIPSLFLSLSSKKTSPYWLLGAVFIGQRGAGGRVPVVAHGEQRCPSHDTGRGLQRARLCWLVVIRGRGALGFGSNMRGERERNGVYTILGFFLFN